MSSSLRRRQWSSVCGCDIDLLAVSSISWCALGLDVCTTPCSASERERKRESASLSHSVDSPPARPSVELSCSHPLSCTPCRSPSIAFCIPFSRRPNEQQQHRCGAPAPLAMQHEQRCLRISHPSAHRRVQVRLLFLFNFDLSALVTSSDLVGHGVLLLQMRSIIHACKCVRDEFKVGCMCNLLHLEAAGVVTSPYFCTPVT